MKRVAGILRDADSSLALTTAKLRDLLAAGIEGLGLERPIAVRGHRRCAARRRGLVDDAAHHRRHRRLPAVHLRFDRRPEGRRRHPRQRAEQRGRDLRSRSASTPTSVLVGWIPHFHDMGLIGQLLAFFNGANLVMMSPLAFLKQPVRLLKAISDYRGTITAAPNFAYDLIARRVTPEQLAGLDLSTWEVALNGAEPVRRRTIERINGLARPGRIRAVGDASRLRHGRGDTDGHRQPRRASATSTPTPTRSNRTATYLPTDRAVSLVSSGEPAPGIDVRIVDPETLHVLPEGQVGEIWLRSASVASGYHNRPERDGRTVPGPHLRRRAALSAHRRPRAAARGRALRHRPPARTC